MDSPGGALVISFNGVEPSAELAEAARLIRPAGYTLFKRNIGARKQLLELIAWLNQIHQEWDELPPLIAIDHEGGVVHRLGDLATRFPGNLALGFTRNPGLARAQAQTTAAELRGLGFNFLFAPALDVLSNPTNPQVLTRSFGAEPALVASLGAAMIQGFQAGGLAATAKHFPGLGACSLDTHHSLPIVNEPWAVLDACELAPFRAAIASDVKAIMTSHAVYPGLDDSGLPATCSPTIITQLLRSELGFTGVVITDALEMGALEQVGLDDAALAAFAAGCDLLLICSGLPDAYALHETMRRGLDDNVIEPQRLTAALSRVRALRRWLAEQASKPYPRQAEWTAEQLRTEIAERGLTLLTDPGFLLPAPLTRFKAVKIFRAITKTSTPVAESSRGSLELFVTRLSKKNHAVRYYEQAEPDTAEVHDLELGILLARNLFLEPDTAARWRSVIARGGVWILVSLGAPADLGAMSIPAVTWLSTADDGPASMHALADVLLGERQALGYPPLIQEEV